MAAAAGLVALRLFAGPAHAAEPPAIVEPPPVITPSPGREYSFEAAAQYGYARMGEWNDGMRSLVDQARASGGLEVATTNLPAYTVSFDALALAQVAGPFMLGLHYDRATGKSEFSVIETGGSSTNLTEYPSEAEAASNVWLFTVRGWLPGARRGVRPYLQGGAGAGSARLTFSTSNGGAHGKGRGFAGSIEAGLHVGDTPVRFRVAAGWRLHRVSLSYNSVRAASQPGASRYFFDDDDELRAFTRGRDVDFGGGYGRLGLAYVFAR